MFIGLFSFERKELLVKFGVHKVFLCWQVNSTRKRTKRTTTLSTGGRLMTESKLTFMSLLQQSRTRQAIPIEPRLSSYKGTLCLLVSAWMKTMNNYMLSSIAK